jgi:kinetochore protein Spc25, fungi type
MKRKDIEILQLKVTTHSQTLAKETQETQEMNSAIAILSSQRDEREAQRDRLRIQLQETQTAIQSRLTAQAEHARHLDTQSRFNVPELDFWQDYLCMRIEGAGQDDRLKFVFSHIDERSWEKEGWFELDCGSREYKVLTARPKLEADNLDRVVNKLNESRDLAVFLKEMRGLFVTAVTS